MMGDGFRRVGVGISNIGCDSGGGGGGGAGGGGGGGGGASGYQGSPKSSPRAGGVGVGGVGGARSPVVVHGQVQMQIQGGANTSTSTSIKEQQPRQDSSGTLKTTISLGKNPSIVHSGPFYLMKEPPPGESELTGAKNLMAYYSLEHSYSKFSGKKLKEQLSSFLPNLPGIIDGPGQQDNSTLRSVIDKPPICGKELVPLTSAQLAGFRLHPGPLPEQYRYVNTTPVKKHKNKHKKHKHKEGGPLSQETQLTDASNPDTHEKKHKKQKRHDEEKERKKRKKEKKRKKQKHSPEHAGSLTPSQHSNG